MKRAAETDYPALLLVVCTCFVAGLLGAGCATTNERIQRCQEEVSRLESHVDRQQTQIAELDTLNDHLMQELTYHKRREKVLEKEKGARKSQAESAIQSVRAFTRKVSAVVRDAASEVTIVDFVGNETVPRKYLSEETEKLLIDTTNRLPADGQITGARAYVAIPGKLRFCLLRPEGQGEEVEIVARSDECPAVSPGVKTWLFEPPMAGRKGDMIAAFAPEQVPLPFDDVATGKVIMLDETPKVNQTLRVTPPEGRKTRAFSFGFIGYLQDE